MNKRTLVLALGTAVAVFGQPPGEGPRGGMRGDPLFTALDADSDGVVSASELAKAPAALRKLDKNSDGKLTEDEIRPAFGPGGPGAPGGEGRGRRPDGPGETQPPDMVQTMLAFDRNGDGKLDKTELPERMQSLLARGDSNQDGFLTKDEIQKLAAGQSAPGEGAGGREGGRTGGREGMRRGGPGGLSRFNPIFGALDSDTDGTLSATEIDNAPASLKKLDKDADGAISREEARPNFPALPPDGAQRPRREGVL